MKPPSMEKLFEHLERRRTECSLKASEFTPAAAAARGAPEDAHARGQKEFWYAGMAFAFGEVITHLRLECMSVSELLQYLDRMAAPGAPEDSAPTRPS